MGIALESSARVYLARLLNTHILGRIATEVQRNRSETMKRSKNRHWVGCRIANNVANLSLSEAVQSRAIQMIVVIDQDPLSPRFLDSSRTAKLLRSSFHL